MLSFVASVAGRMDNVMKLILLRSSAVRSGKIVKNISRYLAALTREFFEDSLL